MKVCCYAEPMEKGLFLHYPTKAVKAEIEHLYKGAKEKYNGYMTVTLDKPYKSRTTGEGSQNNLFWKLVEYISNENGEEVTYMDYYAVLEGAGGLLPRRLGHEQPRPLGERQVRGLL